MDTAIANDAYLFTSEFDTALPEALIAACGSAALFEQYDEVQDDSAQRWPGDAANDDAYENLYPFPS